MSSDAYVPKKLFTVRQANRMLPLVSRIASDVVSSYGRLVESYHRFREVWPEEEVALEQGRLDELRTLRDDMEQAKQVVAEYARELDELGVVLNGEAEGLVDFPALLDGRVVFLCWKLGEPEVAHWHEIEAGFRGRRPLSAIDASDPTDCVSKN